MEQEFIPQIGDDVEQILPADTISEDRASSLIMGDGDGMGAFGMIVHLYHGLTGTHGRAGPPVDTIECFLQQPRAWGWLRFGLLRRLWLWLFRVRGGFVCPFCWFASAVGFGRPALRWFRLSLMFVRVWCWFWSFAFGLGFGRVWWFRFIFPLFGASSWSAQAKIWEVRVTN